MSLLILTLSCKQTVCAAACKSSPLKCFSRDSWRPACVLQHSWLTASCFLISPVMAPPRPASSAEWYLRHKLLRFSWVELMLLCWLWSSFCISYKRRVCHEGCSSHSRKIVHLLYYGHFLGNWCCWNPLSNVYVFMRLCVCVCEWKGDDRLEMYSLVESMWFRDQFIMGRKLGEKTQCFNLRTMDQ